MKTTAALGILLVAALPVSGAETQPEISAQARSLHFGAILVDTHDDTTQRLLDPAYDFGARHTDGAVDIPRMREGGLDALFFSIWVPGTVTGATATEQALRQIGVVRRQAELHPKDIVLAVTADDVRRAAARGQIAALLGVEGGHMLGDDLKNVGRFFDLGVRYMTLTHSVNTSLADSSGDKPAHRGLSQFGRTVVAEMNRLGMIVDISHVSDRTFYDVLAVSQAPVFASHSSCRALCNSPRNMTDRMIKDLAAKGGVIQINYYNGFLSRAFRDAYNANDGRIDKEIAAEAARRCGADVLCREDLEPLRLQYEYIAAGRLPKVDWTAIVEHIDHAVRLVGAEHVGLGSDFDGATTPVGMEDASRLPRITDALLKRGYAPRDIESILGGNTLRVLGEVQAVAARLAAQPKR